MSRKGGLVRVEPRAGSFKPPRWGDDAIGKRMGTPPRKRPLAVPLSGSVIMRGRDGGKSTDVMSVRPDAGASAVNTKSKSPGSCELPSDGSSERARSTTVFSSR